MRLRRRPKTDEARAAKLAARDDRKARAAFFDEAARHTPYVAVEVDGMTFVVATWDRLGRGLFSESRRAEMETMGSTLELLDRLGLGGDRSRQTFVDVGANIGTSTVTAVVRHGFGRALAIEPEPRNLRVLRLNVAANDLAGRVSTHGCAIADAPGDAPLVVYADSSGKHRVGSAREGQDTVVVPQRTLDSVLAEEVIAAPDVGLLWIDTQGYEGHVLAGARTLLEQGTPVVAEVAPKHLGMSGGRPLLVAALREHYTHFIDLRDPDESQLSGIDAFEALVDDYETRSTGRFTDVLAVRLG